MWWKAEHPDLAVPVVREGELPPEMVRVVDQVLDEKTGEVLEEKVVEREAFSLTEEDRKRLPVWIEIDQAEYDDLVRQTEESGWLSLIERRKTDSGDGAQ